jgi:hypothetical protein
VIEIFKRFLVFAALKQKDGHFANHQFQRLQDFIDQRFFSRTMDVTEKMGELILIRQWNEFVLGGLLEEKDTFHRFDQGIGSRRFAGPRRSRNVQDIMVEKDHGFIVVDELDLTQVFLPQISLGRFARLRRAENNIASSI